MDLVQIIEEICRDCSNKTEAFERLKCFGLIDIRALKYLYIHKSFMHNMSLGYKIMDAMFLTAEDFNISIKQVINVRKYWKSRNAELLVDIDI